MKHHTPTTITLLVVTLLAILLLSSCTVTEQLSLQTSTYSHSLFDFTVEDFFLDVLEDFSEFTPTSQDTSLVDSAIDEFEEALSLSWTTKDVSIDRINDNAYKGEFFFMDLGRLFSDLGAGNDQSFMRIHNQTLTFNLCMDNYDQLVPVIPFLADENFEAFGPVYNQGLSEDDYLEMISFMLGEEGPPAIEQSVITLHITTPQPITSFVEGKKLSSNQYEFSFPLIDFLLLSEPITFTVSW